MRKFETFHQEANTKLKADKITYFGKHRAFLCLLFEKVGKCAKKSKYRLDRALRKNLFSFHWEIHFTTAGLDELIISSLAGLGQGSGNDTKTSEH